MPLSIWSLIKSASLHSNRPNDWAPSGCSLRGVFMRNKPTPVTFRIACAFDAYDSTVPARMVGKLKGFFTKSIKINCEEKPYPARLVFSNVPIDLLPSVYTAILIMMGEHVGETKGVSIVQERGGIK